MSPINKYLLASFVLSGAFSARAQSPISAARNEVAGRTATEGLWRGAALTDSEPVSNGALGEDILLLQKSLPFFFRLNSDYSYSTNATYDFTEQADWHFGVSAGLGVETIIDNKWHVLLESAASWTRYDKFDFLDRETLGAAASVTRSFDHIHLALSYSSQWYYRDDFSVNDSTFHHLTFRGVYNTTIDDMSFSVGPIIGLTKSDPSDFDVLNIGVQAGVVYTHDESSSAGLFVQYGYNAYSHYMPTVFNKDRRDHTFGVSFFYSYKISKFIEIRPEVRFNLNESNLEATNLLTGKQVGLYDYKAWEFMPSLSVRIQF